MRPLDAEIIASVVLVIVGLTLLFGPWVMVGLGAVWLVGNGLA